MARKQSEAEKTLRRAKRLLERKGWTKHHFAVNKNELAVEPDDKEAVAFCALGALQRANGPGERLARDYLRWTVPNGDITGFNDRPSTRKEHVLQMFEKAIEHAKRNTR